MSFFVNMTQTEPTRPIHFSLRLSPEERVRLEREAVGMGLGPYIRWRVFNPDTPPPRLRGKFPVKDHQALSRVLANLGQSRLANNLNQLAKLANSGSLPFTPEIVAAITQACSEVADMRRDLMTALQIEDSQ